MALLGRHRRRGGVSRRAARRGDRCGRPPDRARLLQPRLTDPRALLGREVERVDRAFFAARLAEAGVLRRAVLPAETTGYRVLNAEGDGVPGWTVDRYGDVLVSQVTVAGLEALRAEAYAALAEAFPGARDPAAQRLPARRPSGSPSEDEVIAGGPRRRGALRRGGAHVLGRARQRAEDRLLLRPAREPPARRAARRGPPRARPLRPHRRLRRPRPARGRRAGGPRRVLGAPDRARPAALAR